MQWARCDHETSQPPLPLLLLLLQERAGAALDAPFQHLGALFYRSFLAEMEAAAEL